MVGMPDFSDRKVELKRDFSLLPFLLMSGIPVNASFLVIFHERQGSVCEWNGGEGSEPKCSGNEPSRPIFMPVKGNTQMD
jgi:hypothetical protein